MTFSTLIFSKEKKIVFTRHFLFWFCWFLYYSTQSFLYRLSHYSVETSLISALFNNFLSTVLDMSYCYSLVYILIPRFYFTGRFKHFFGWWMGVTIFTTFCYVGHYRYLVPYLNTLFFDFPDPSRAPIYSAILHYFGVVAFFGCMAAAIVLGKNWYKSNQKLIHLRRKQSSLLNKFELQGHLLVPYPVFRSLLYDLSDATAKPMPGIRHLVEEIVSHAQVKKISLDEELKKTNAYLQLLKTRFPTLDIQFPARMHDHDMLANLLLSLASLPFLDEKNIDTTQPMTARAEVVQDDFHFELSWYKKDNHATFPTTQYEQLQFLKNSLEFNYASSYTLATHDDRLQAKLVLTLKLERLI
jgi:hypothetical protein